jgi:hypothetical protein
MGQMGQIGQMKPKWKRTIQAIEYIVEVNDISDNDNHTRQDHIGKCDVRKTKNKTLKEILFVFEHLVCSIGLPSRFSGLAGNKF